MASTRQRVGGKRNIELDVVFDAVTFDQDFDSFLGRSTFNSVLAAVVEEDYRGQPTFDLVDVLGLVEPLYAKDKNYIGSQKGHFEFYSYITSIKRSSSKDEWLAFCQKLYIRVAIACKRLLKKPVHELSPTTMPGPHKFDTVRVPTSHSSGDSECSVGSSEFSAPPPRHTDYARPSAFDDIPFQTRQASNSGSDHTISQNDDNMPNYTSLLKEHVDIVGGDLRYTNKEVSSNPITWRCVATLDKLSSEGTGRNTKQAKHAASKKMCELLGLSID